MIIRTYRMLWAARLIRWAARIYPGDLNEIMTDLERETAQAVAGAQAIRDRRNVRGPVVKS